MKPLLPGPFGEVLRGWGLTGLVWELSNGKRNAGREVHCMLSSITV